MNFDLLENFGHNYPEEFECTLDCVSIAVTTAFNKRGTLLAVGCNDGRLVFWDFLTKGIAKIIPAHMHPICSMSWSRDGFKLISACTDNTVCIWNIVSGECEQKYRFPNPILKVQFHPKNEHMFLVCPMRHAAVLVDTDGDHQSVPTEDDDFSIVASFDRNGLHVYTGNGKGKILVFSCPALVKKVSFKAATTAIKSIEFARRGDSLLLNTGDRLIRVYNGADILQSGRKKGVYPEPIQKLQDLVNKTMWKKCCFSGDGDYVCAGSARQHALYIWEKSVGNLVKILHGTKGELLLDVVWHPVRPIVASISGGVVSLWSQNQVENWSAFAPDFKELDENVEYEERESEFDIEDEDKSIASGMDEEDEDVDVDVEEIEPIAAFVSSEDDDDYDSDYKVLEYLPSVPEVDDPEDTPGTSSGVSSYTPPKALKPPKILKTYDIQLDGPTCKDVHPMVAKSSKNKSSKDKSYKDKPSTSSKDKPSTSSKDKPSTSSKDKPSTSSKDKPSTSSKDKPSTSRKTNKESNKRSPKQHSSNQTLITDNLVTKKLRKN